MSDWEAGLYDMCADRFGQITGVFMTAQAVAKEMIKHGRGGSIVMIASMSGSIANRVGAHSSSLGMMCADRLFLGSYLSW